MDQQPQPLDLDAIEREIGEYTEGAALIAEVRRLREQVAELDSFAQGCDGEGCVLPHSSWCERAKAYAADHDGCTCGRPWEGAPQPHSGHCWLVHPPHPEVDTMRAELRRIYADRSRLRAELQQARQQTAHDPIECDHQAEAGQLAEQVKRLRAALNSIESDAERAARKGYDLDAEDIRATANHALTPAAASGCGCQTRVHPGHYPSCTAPAAVSATGRYRLDSDLDNLR